MFDDAAAYERPRSPLAVDPPVEDWHSGYGYAGGASPDDSDMKVDVAQAHAGAGYGRSDVAAVAAGVESSVIENNVMLSPHAGCSGLHGPTGTLALTGTDSDRQVNQCSSRLQGAAHWQASGDKGVVSVVAGFVSTRCRRLQPGNSMLPRHGVVVELERYVLFELELTTYRCHHDLVSLPVAGSLGLFFGVSKSTSTGTGTS